MKSWFQRRFARMLVVVLCVGLAATWAVGQAVDKREAARRDRNEVGRLTDKMKTVCVGRFLIDMPIAAQVELRQARVDGFDISAFHELDEEFHRRVADRKAQIVATPDWRGGDKNLETAREVNTASFWSKVNGTEDNVLIPHLVLTMTTGNGKREPVPSSLSDDAALRVWDKIVSSIRLRTVEPQLETTDTRVRR